MAAGDLASVAPRYVAREATFGAFADAILALWAAHLHDTTRESAAAKRRHWYEENPAGAGACVVLHAGSEARPVGVQCLLERTQWRGPDPTPVAGLAEFAIDPGHRSLGPALLLIKKCLEIGRTRYALVYGLPNPNAFSVCKRAGLRHAGDMVRFVLPRRLDLLLSRRETRGLRWLAAPVDLLLSLRIAARALRHRAPQRWRQVGFDAGELAALWDARPGYLRLSERAPRALAWRFRADAGWKVALAADRSGTPMGYVVWRPEGDLVKLGDFFCVDPDRLTGALLSGFARHVGGSTNANGLELEFCGRPEVLRGARAAGFLPRGVMCPLVLDRGDDAGAGIDQLYFTTFDRVSD